MSTDLSLSELVAHAVRAGARVEIRLRRPGSGDPDVVVPLRARARVGAWGGEWELAVGVVAVDGRQGCFDLTVSVGCVTGEGGEVVASVECVFSDWDPATFILAPAMLYDGNRFEVVDVPYSPFWPDASHYGIDKAVTITHQPHLARDGGAGHVELDSFGLATPCLGLHAPSGSGLLLLTPDVNEWGPLGLSVEESSSPSECRFVAGSPRFRSRVPGHMGFQPGDAAREWRAGEVATLRVRLWWFEAERRQGLFDRFAEARKDFGLCVWRNGLPFSAAGRLVRDKLNAWNWDEALGYYRHGLRREGSKPFDWWQLGWVSGGITTLPMLAQGDDGVRSRARRNLDFMFTQSPVANGLWRAHHDGTKFNPDDPRPPRPGYQVSVRRLGDGLHYGLKQILLLAERGESVPPAWDDSVRHLADALVRVFETHGQLGQYLDIRTAGILIGGSTAGGGVPAGLVLAARRFGDSRYLRLAETIGEHFVVTAVERGVTTGGPCDALTAPDSESCFALLASLVELHQATGDARWARAARDVTRQFATWVTSYDFTWPTGSAMDRLGAPAHGTVWANIQNKHASPGICTYSGEHLFRLWRATGDEFALELLRDIAHNITFHVSRPGHPLAALDPGMMCERVNLGDWEGQGTVGDNIFGSTIWVETALLLTTAELPGVYVQTDTGRVVVLDHVTAEWTERGLQLTNPTQHDAEVCVLAETSEQMRKPLRTLITDAGKVVSLKAGGSGFVPREALLPG